MSAQRLKTPDASPDRRFVRQPAVLANLFNAELGERSLHDEHDPRCDAGFSLFYLGISIGALLGPLLTGPLQDGVGLHGGRGVRYDPDAASPLVIWIGLASRPVHQHTSGVD